MDETSEGVAPRNRRDLVRSLAERIVGMLSGLTFMALELSKYMHMGVK
jgi:hypothetical protein